MKIDIKKSSTLHLSEESIISYGGTSKIYKPYDEKFCYKWYKKKISDETRQIIQENIISLSNTKLPNCLIVPDTLYLDENEILQVAKMNYIDGATGYNACHAQYNNSKYIRIVSSIIDLITELTRKKYIVSDLKLNNLFWDKNYNLFAIDNDFTFYQKVPDDIKEFIRTNRNVRMYNDIFGDLDPDYNLYRLYLILARLLLSLDEYEYFCSIKPTKKNIRENKMLKTLNYFIQKNKGIPQEFKMQMRNLFTGDKEIRFDEDMKDDIISYLKKRRY